MKPLNPFESYIQAMTALASQAYAEPALLDAAEPLLAELIASDAWLPEAYTLPSDKTYQQYLLYRDPLARFSVVSFVWGPGQKTPIHDHTVWGLIGVLRGAERCHHFGRDAQGHWHDEGVHILGKGEVDRVSPNIGDVHRVSNALPDQVTISIHVYGADIGQVKRHVFEEGSFAEREFVSGYVNHPPLMASASASRPSVF
jgi:3-mercaptopropionate dioxygenase